jgi:hypothetical protein
MSALSATPNCVFMAAVAAALSLAQLAAAGRRQWQKWILCPKGLLRLPDLPSDFASSGQAKPYAEYAAQAAQAAN